MHKRCLDVVAGSGMLPRRKDGAAGICLKAAPCPAAVANVTESRACPRLVALDSSTPNWVA